MTNPKSTKEWKPTTAFSMLYAACAEFVQKVEDGEARSVRSYGAMKAALAKADEEMGIQ